jgi:hypothetical protein
LWIPVAVHAYRDMRSFVCLLFALALSGLACGEVAAVQPDAGPGPTTDAATSTACVLDQSQLDVCSL